MPPNEPINRITAKFKGKVQGVGFRYTVCQIAEPMEVSGYVKNIPDGSVELVAEGSEAVLAQLIERIGRQMGGNIREHAVAHSSATGEFTAFSIAY